MKNVARPKTLGLTYSQVCLDACECLIFKLLIPPDTVGREKTEMKVHSMKDWNNELKLFQNHQGLFAKDYIWELTKVK